MFGNSEVKGTVCIPSSLLACPIPMEPINLCLIKDVFIVVSILCCKDNKGNCQNSISFKIEKQRLCKPDMPVSNVRLLKITSTNPFKGHITLLV